MIILMYSINNNLVFSQNQTLCSQLGNLSGYTSISGVITTPITYQNQMLDISNGIEFKSTVRFVNCTLKVGSSIKITSANGNKGLAEFNNCKLFSSSCSSLWSGIEVRGRYIRIFNGTIIEDAINAIRFLDGGGLLYMHNSELNRNFNGIVADNGADQIVRFVTFSGNKIRCTSNLNSTVGASDKAETGILLRFIAKTGILNIGLSSSTVNEFDNLTNGILAIDVDLAIANCKFSNINGNTNSSRSGIAIQYEPINRNGYLKVTGLGTDNNSTATFTNCYRHNILSYSDLPNNSNIGDAEIEITNCKSINNTAESGQKFEAFIINKNNGIKTELIDNKIELSNTQPHLLINGAKKLRRVIGLEGGSTIRDIKLYSNTINLNNITQTTIQETDPELIGISLRNIFANNATLNKALLSSNKINEDNCRNCIAISSEGTNKLDIHNNTEIKRGINSTSNSYNRPAIRIKGGEKIDVTTAEITSKYGLDGQIGIFVSDAKFVFLCNNKICNDRISLKIEGGSTNCHVSANLIGSGQNGTTAQARIGLHYVDKTRTNFRNPHRKNIWAGTFSTREAQHEGSTFLSNIYVINSNNYGTSTKYWPTARLPTSNWIQPKDVLLDSSCSSSQDFTNVDGFNPFCDSDYSQNFTDDVLWYQYKDFVRIIRDNNLENSLGCLESLYDSLMSTSVPDYLDISVQYHNLHNYNTNITNSILNYNSDNQDLDQLILDELEEIDQVLSNNQEPDYTILDSLSILYNENQIIIDSLNDLLKDTVQLKANELYNLNDQLTASTSYELNDKLINKIRLKKILGLSITNAEYTQITELANECINELGDAVINAQLLLNAEDNFYRPELFNCTESEELISANKEIGTQFNVKVTPSILSGAQIIKIQSNKEIEKIQVFNTLGVDISNYFQFQYIDNKYIELKPINNLMSDQLCLVNIKALGESFTHKVFYVNK